MFAPPARSRSPRMRPRPDGPGSWRPVTETMMLGFRWMLDAAGAPDQDDYINGVDRLFTQGGRLVSPAALQEFKKPDESLAGPSAGLQASVDQWLAGRQPRVVVMVHGFDFSVKPDA